MRHNKEPTVIFTKKDEPVLELHCVLHRSNRMKRFEDGSLRCSFCGGLNVATVTKMTVESKEA